ncbi:NADP-dependent oxidoreductase [Streptomyces roseicoloratus]|uniref:NADP-dependent oxidoreductase n=1 Tax=Streptomyces roseicoloratus TaxID=2508722 RepID=A0ABY9RYY8_9ACTN|nr:NADP-dependent oxidoreductase [Streptomyces roseicoloratus]WMX46394.1 NADP-dependent oxidoreductase [Streptomyces roseicoloratus]
MEAVVYEEFGGVEVLRHEAGVETPEPGPGEVRVKVAVAGVNPVDWKRRNGWLEDFYPTTFPAVPGMEFAGTVEALGEGVTELAVGDEVFGWTKTGAYAQYALSDASAVVAKPAVLSWEHAASLVVAGETAHRVLDLLGVREGETLLLHGAAGAVGALAAQLAVAAGVTVVGTASERNHGFLRELGVHPVTYGEGLGDRVRAAAPQGVDAVFDAAGRDTLPLSIELLGGEKSRIVTIAAPDAADHGIVFSGVAVEAPLARRRLAGLAGLAAEGRLRLDIAEVLPLKEAARAQELSEAGHVRGKLILVP